MRTRTNKRCLWLVILLVQHSAISPAISSSNVAFLRSEWREESAPLFQNPQQHYDDAAAARELIINGESATSLQDYQFFVRSWPDAVRQTPDLLCGASLIHNDIILTAAHCHGAFNYGAMLYNPYVDSFTWYQTVDKQIPHPEYYSNLNLINYDIMVLRLSEPASNIVPVRLNSDPDFPVPGRDITEASGFGLIDVASGTVSNDLQVGYFQPLSNDECRQRGRFVNVVLSSDVMCVDPLTDDSVCAGDSGGPLTVPIVRTGEQQQQQLPQNSLSGLNAMPMTGVDDGAAAIQVGVISFGTDCQADDVPDGMARVSYFFNWIQEQICRHSRNPPLDCPALSDYDEVTTADALIFHDVVTVELIFHHDFMAEETTFSVRNYLTDKIEYAGPDYVPQRGEQKSTTFLLFPGNYIFEVYDTNGDGLKNPFYVPDTYPTGSWTLYAVYPDTDKVELASGDENFERLQTTPFQVPVSQPSVDGEVFPTEAPTYQPPTTISPTFIPTLVPTNAATPQITDPFLPTDDTTQNENNNTDSTFISNSTTEGDEDGSPPFDVSGGSANNPSVAASANGPTFAFSLPCTILLVWILR